MAVLETNIQPIEQEVFQAADSRFFNASGVLELNEALPGMPQFILSSQKSLASTALRYSEMLEIAQDQLITARYCPNAIPKETVEYASSKIVDKGALWRRTTDEIAANISRHLPMTRLGRLVLGGGIFYTDEKRLYERSVEQSGDYKMHVYNSSPSSEDINGNIIVADKEHWHGLLHAIRLVRL